MVYTCSPGSVYMFSIVYIVNVHQFVMHIHATTIHWICIYVCLLEEIRQVLTHGKDQNTTKVYTCAHI